MKMDQSGQKRTNWIVVKDQYGFDSSSSESESKSIHEGSKRISKTKSKNPQLEKSSVNLPDLIVTF